jgi:hypothetical protein
MGWAFEVHFHLKIPSLLGLYAAYNEWTTFHPVQNAKRAQISFSSRQKPETALISIKLIPFRFHLTYSSSISFFLSSLFLPTVFYMDFFCSYGWMTFVVIDRMELTQKLSIFITHPFTKCQISVVVLHLFFFNRCLHFAWLQVSAHMKKGPIGYPDTSERNCLYPLLNSPEECSSHLPTLHDTNPFNMKRDCFIWLRSERNLNFLGRYWEIPSTEYH